MRLPPETPKRARIEIVPMIDAIFFLLVFFMFSSLSMVKLNGLTAALPQTPGAATGSSRPGPARDAPHLMVDVRTGGDCLVAGQRTDTRALARTVTARLEQKPGSLVILRAEKGSSMQQLVSVVDVLNDVHTHDGSRPTVLIATERVTAPSQTVAPAGSTPPRPARP